MHDQFQSCSFNNSNLLNPLLYDSSQVLDGREMMDDLCEDYQAISDLDKVFALQTNNQSLGNFVMPLMTNMPNQV